MRPQTISRSSGSLGEQLAELWFKGKGWKMERHQPPTRIISINKKPIVVNCKSQGVADYTGYEMVLIPSLSMQLPLFRACEVKEAYGPRMPASRLDKAQRDWLRDIDPRCAFVGIAWMNNPVFFELHKFIYSGSYKRGEGIK